MKKKEVKMKLVLGHKVKSGHYKAGACIFWCFDDRFNSMLDAARDFYKLEYADEIKAAGGARELVHGWPSEKALLLDQLEKSVKLHHTPLVILMVHQDCGAYGKSFKTPETELAFYSKELELAKRVVLDFAASRGFKLEVKLVFASFDGLMELE